jgi:hypothetical protein
MMSVKLKSSLYFCNNNLICCRDGRERACAVLNPLLPEWCAPLLIAREDHSPVISAQHRHVPVPAAIRVTSFPSRPFLPVNLYPSLITTPRIILQGETLILCINRITPLPSIISDILSTVFHFTGCFVLTVTIFGSNLN